MRLFVEPRGALDRLRRGRVKSVPPRSELAVRAPIVSAAPRRDATSVPLIVPATVSSLPLGLQGLVGNLSGTAATRLAEQDLVPVLIATDSPAIVAAAVKRMRGSASALSRSGVAASVPRRRLPELAAHEAVRRVEAGVRLKPHLDLAHASARLVAAGVRTVPQTGAGVLIGIVDTGIDVTHPGFRNGGKTRIVDYLDQTTGAGFSKADIDAGGGTESPDVIGHGTHVAGIAAGSGAGMPGSPFVGVAREADLAIVKTTFDTTDIAAGIAHVFSVAESRTQPCVVNLSFGGHFGGHDGSSVLERIIDEQCDRPGRVVVASAGNEGTDRIHAGTTLPRGEPHAARWVADFELKSRVIQDTLIGALFVDVWTLHEDTVRVQLRSPNGELLGAPVGGEAEFDRSVFVVQAIHEVAPYSGDHHTTFGVFAVPDSQWLSGWSLIVEEDRGEGKPGVGVGRVHAWILDESMGAFTQGFTRTHLVGMPGTTFSAITVASYATRREWDSQDPTNPHMVLEAVNLEDISYFSSPGPTREEGNKPDVAAPGQWLVSAQSTKASEQEMPSWVRLPGGAYASLQGTSMSAPYVTGAMALLLEKAPKLHWAEVKWRLYKSCRVDRFSTPCWNARWGYGKLDVKAFLAIEPA